jgi:LysR family cys regulon transcriptional activator
LTFAFALWQFAPNIVLTAMDADVIKTYVQLGMGVASSPPSPLRANRDTAFYKGASTRARALWH